MDKKGRTGKDAAEQNKRCENAADGTYKYMDAEANGGQQQYHSFIGHEKNDFIIFGECEKDGNAVERFSEIQYIK